MHLIKSFSVGNAFSTVLDKFNLNKPQDDPQAQNGQRRSYEMANHTGELSSRYKLHFHSRVHGKAITLNDDFSIARRDERYFEHSVVFSHRPISTNEMIAVEIVELSTEFHGPLRIGFTSCNPLSFQDEIVPLGRDLKCKHGFWLKSVQLFPIVSGTIIYFKLGSDGTVLYGVDGENGGAFLKDVDVTKTLWVVLEAYGAVQALKFVEKSMPLTNLNCSIFDSDLNDNSPLNNSRLISRHRGQVVRRVLLRPINSPLNARRNVPLAPLQNLVPTPCMNEPPQTPNSPMTPAFESPAFSNLGPCIMCMEHEKDTAFTDCGHLCMCNNCAKSFKEQLIPSGRSRMRFRKNLCPMCRQPIKGVLKIYA